MSCPVCGGRVYDSGDIIQCQECGKRDIKRDFYAMSVECGECGHESLRLGVSGSICQHCGNDRVNVRTVKVPIGCAIIEKERAGMLPSK